jgi:tetratricopeptide (TPR) repeat protein
MPEAIAAYHQAVELSDKPVYKQNLAEAYEKVGKQEDAIHWYAAAVEDHDRMLAAAGQSQRAAILGERAFSLAKTGRFDEARSDIEEALALEPQQMSLLRAAARVYALAGERSLAFAYIRKAIAVGYPGEDLHRDPVFADYLADSDFIDLLTSGR